MRELNNQAARLFLGELRAARAAAFADAEAFPRIALALERFGNYRARSRRGLGGYRREILGTAEESPLSSQVPSAWPGYHHSSQSLFDTVLQRRNDAMHVGTYARHVAQAASELCLILEDALGAKMTSATEFMVRSPVCVEPWQPVSYARRLMLLNSFSYLPIHLEVAAGKSPSWHLISDADLARFLFVGAKKREKRLAQTLGTAIASAELQTLPAQTASHDSPVHHIARDMAREPVLILENDSGRLLGLITAFDLL